MGTGVHFAGRSACALLANWCAAGLFACSTGASADEGASALAADTVAMDAAAVDAGAMDKVAVDAGARTSAQAATGLDGETAPDSGGVAQPADTGAPCLGGAGVSEDICSGFTVACEADYAAVFACLGFWNQARVGVFDATVACHAALAFGDPCSSESVTGFETCFAASAALACVEPTHECEAIVQRCRALPRALCERTLAPFNHSLRQEVASYFSEIEAEASVDATSCEQRLNEYVERAKTPTTE